MRPIGEWAIWACLGSLGRFGSPCLGSNGLYERSGASRGPASAKKALDVGRETTL